MANILSILGIKVLSEHKVTLLCLILLLLSLLYKILNQLFRLWNLINDSLYFYNLIQTRLYWNCMYMQFIGLLYYTTESSVTDHKWNRA